MSMYVMSHTEVEILDDGGLELVELSPVHPWEADPREPLELQEGEFRVCMFYVLYFTFTFYTGNHVNS